jgi:hypothetical protein
MARNLGNSIIFSAQEDHMIWSYESSGVYSSKFLYEIVNFKGIQHIYLPENDVYESFGVMITDFLSLESKWLCNTRYM